MLQTRAAAWRVVTIPLKLGCGDDTLPGGEISELRPMADAVAFTLLREAKDDVLVRCRNDAFGYC